MVSGEPAGYFSGTMLSSYTNYKYEKAKRWSAEAHIAHARPTEGHDKIRALGLVDGGDWFRGKVGGAGALDRAPALDLDGSARDSDRQSCVVDVDVAWMADEGVGLGDPRQYVLHVRNCERRHLPAPSSSARGGKSEL